MGSGPGWAGSGGPWVKPEQSMMHLVSSSIEVKGPGLIKPVLPVPAPRSPSFGEGSVPGHLKVIRNDWYEDVAVLAYPTPNTRQEITKLDEKTLVYRAPCTSQPGASQFLPSLNAYPEIPGSAVKQEDILNLTGKLSPDGILDWEVPAGRWTIVRFGTRNNGAITRPAPGPGLGFECDKLDTAAFNAHSPA